MYIKRIKDITSFSLFFASELVNCIQHFQHTFSSTEKRPTFGQFLIEQTSNYKMGMTLFQQKT